MKHEQLTAWALNELSPEEKAHLETALHEDAAAQKNAKDTREFCDFLSTHLFDANIALEESQRAALRQAAASNGAGINSTPAKVLPAPAAPRPWWRGSVVRGLAAAAVIGILAIGAAFLLRDQQSSQPTALALHVTPEKTVAVQASEIMEIPTGSQGLPTIQAEHDDMVRMPPMDLAQLSLPFGATPPGTPQTPDSVRGLIPEDTQWSSLALTDPPAQLKPDQPLIAANDALSPVLRIEPGAAGGFRPYDYEVGADSYRELDLSTNVTFANRGLITNGGTLQTMPSALPQAGSGGVPPVALSAVPSTISYEKETLGNQSATAADPKAKAAEAGKLLTKSGAGTLVLNGASTYAGATVISGSIAGTGSTGAVAMNPKPTLTSPAAPGAAGPAPGDHDDVTKFLAEAAAPAPTRTAGRVDASAGKAVGDKALGVVVTQTRSTSAPGYLPSPVPAAPAAPAAAPAAIDQLVPAEPGFRGRVLKRNVDPGKDAPASTTLVVGDVIPPAQIHPKPAPTDPVPLLEELPVLGKLFKAEKAQPNNESYTPIVENTLQDVTRAPLSTFSIDVDTAAYANVRRFLNQNTPPPPDAVRIEELVNYFPTNAEGPAADAKEPFAVAIEMAECPWQPLHRLARINIKGRELGVDRKPSNLVFLVDVSGSMDEPNKLPLVQQSLRMLTEKLGEEDRVSMVVYAGSSGLILPPTNGMNKPDILAAIDRLKAGGSTHGSAGIRLAYEQAVGGFIKGGVNRVILCTDGDFNVGVSSPEELEKLITEKARSGVFLSVLGYGTGNLKDRTMETLADKGNGNYSYIDSLSEARKVLVEQMGGTLVTIAKDVKIQVEFNPRVIRSYRLIGYENRLLAKEDFNDDTKDAGEIGAGHTVTALYELVPANLPPGAEPRAMVDDLRYQPAPAAAAAPAAPAPLDDARAKEALTVKLRYKEPEGSTSRLIEVPVNDDAKRIDAASGEFKFTAAVAGFGLLLRHSSYSGALTWEKVRDLAQQGKGTDPNGYRGEFLQLIEKARGVSASR